MTTNSHDQPALTAPGIEMGRPWAPGDPLEPPEQALLDHASVGTALDLLRLVGDGRVDHEAMTEWGWQQTIRAGVLRHLLVEPQWFVHTKGVRLRGARISGPLDLESAIVRCPLLLEDCYFDSPDPVALDYATVPRLSLSRCRVAGGFAADLLVVTKGLDLSGSSFEGAVRLSDADIAGPLSCRGAQLKDPGGEALSGQGMRVGGGVFLDQGFTASGAVRLTNADITGPLSCRGAQLVEPGEALSGQGMRVAGGVFLDQGFTATGSVDLSGARVGGSLTLLSAELAEPVALEADGVQVGGQMQWAPRSPVGGLVDLQRAAVHRLDDDWSLPDAHWPPPGRLRLAGFTYDGLGGARQASWQQRLDWIRRSHMSTPGAFATQPYEQLEHVYRQSGQVADAARIRTARFQDLRRYGHITRRERVGNLLLGTFFGYGYRPLRAVGWLVAVYAAVLLVFWGAQHQDGVLVPAKEDTKTATPADTKTTTPPPNALHCSAAYPCFYPAGYAIDIAVPIVNVRQAEYWRPNGDAPWGWAYIAAGWVATGLGWAFATIAAVAYTGLVRKDRSGDSLAELR